MFASVKRTFAKTSPAKKTSEPQVEQYEYSGKRARPDRADMPVNGYSSSSSNTQITHDNYNYNNSAYENEVEEEEEDDRGGFQREDNGQKRAVASAAPFPFNYLLQASSKSNKTRRKKPAKVPEMLQSAKFECVESGAGEESGSASAASLNQRRVESSVDAAEQYRRQFNQDQNKHLSYGKQQQHQYTASNRRVGVAGPKQEPKRTIKHHPYTQMMIMHSNGNNSDRDKNQYFNDRESGSEAQVQVAIDDDEIDGPSGSVRRHSIGLNGLDDEPGDDGLGVDYETEIGDDSMMFPSVNQNQLDHYGRHSDHHQHHRSMMMLHGENGDRHQHQQHLASLQHSQSSWQLSAENHHQHHHQHHQNNNNNNQANLCTCNPQSNCQSNNLSPGGFVNPMGSSASQHQHQLLQNSHTNLSSIQAANNNNNLSFSCSSIRRHHQHQHQQQASGFLPNHNLNQSCANHQFECVDSSHRAQGPKSTAAIVNQLQQHQLYLQNQTRHHNAPSSNLTAKFKPPDPSHQYNSSHNYQLANQIDVMILAARQAHANNNSNQENTLRNNYPSEQADNEYLKIQLEEYKKGVKLSKKQIKREKKLLKKSLKKSKSFESRASSNSNSNSKESAEKGASFTANYCDNFRFQQRPLSQHQSINYHTEQIASNQPASLNYNQLYTIAGNYPSSQSNSGQSDYLVGSSSADSRNQLLFDCNNNRPAVNSNQFINYSKLMMLKQPPKPPARASNQSSSSSNLNHIAATPGGQDNFAAMNAGNLSQAAMMSASMNEINMINNSGSSSKQHLHRSKFRAHSREKPNLGCCGNFAKILLFITNILFWSAGIALGGWGIWSLVEDHKYNLSQLLVFDSSASRMSLFQLLSWSFITLGCASILIGFCGCSAIFKNNRWILGLYIFLILAIFALDLATGLLAIIFQERLITNVRLKLGSKLRMDYGNSASFTAAIDYLQTKFHCCGLDGHFDYDQSSWRLQRLGGFETTVARTCCQLRNQEDDQAHINPLPLNETMCQSQDVRFHQSYRYRRGCLDDLEFLIRQKIWTFTMACGAVGAIILVSLLFATCFCRSMPRSPSGKRFSGSPTSGGGGQQLRNSRQQHRNPQQSYISSNSSSSTNRHPSSVRHKPSTPVHASSRPKSLHR